MQLVSQKLQKTLPRQTWRPWTHAAFARRFRITSICGYFRRTVLRTVCQTCSTIMPCQWCCLKLIHQHLRHWKPPFSLIAHRLKCLLYQCQALGNDLCLQCWSGTVPQKASVSQRCWKPSRSLHDENLEASAWSKTSTRQPVQDGKQCSRFGDEFSKRVDLCSCRGQSWNHGVALTGCSRLETLLAPTCKKKIPRNGSVT